MLEQLDLKQKSEYCDSPSFKTKTPAQTNINKVKLENQISNFNEEIKHIKIKTNDRPSSEFGFVNDEIDNNLFSKQK